MLKHAIDAYNVLLNLAEALKLKLTTLVGLLAVLIAGASLLTTQALGSYSASDVSDQTTVTPKAGQPTPGLSEQSKTETASDKSAGRTDASAAGSAGQASVDSKQSTLSDNSSKASFTTKIERNGQVTVGTLIGYNATKDQKTYYGGDLAFNTANLTFSKKDPTSFSRTLTVSTADDTAVGLPTVVKDETAHRFTLSNDAADSPQTARSFNLTVTLVDDLPVGSYQLHLVAVRNGQAADMWAYHGFVTINVTE
jgi:hypothetical protein